MERHSPLVLTDRICWSGQQIAADIDGQTVALSADYCNYCGLDPIASDIWRRIERPVVIASLCEELDRAYLATPGTIAKDVVALLEQMRVQGLVEVAV